MGNHLISAGQAAKIAGVSISTISKKLSSGKLSYVEKTEQGGYLIDPAELARVYPPKPSAQGSTGPLETAGETPMKARVEVMEGRLEDAQRTIEDLRARLDASEAERRSLSERLLAAPEKPAEGFRARLGRWVAGKS